MMMGLGDFVFKLSTLTYQDLQRQTEWRYASSGRVGAPLAYQSLGPGVETFSMNGTIYPEFGNRKALDTLRNMQKTGQAYAMVDGSGKVYGQYIINTVKENTSHFKRDGTPLKTEFSVELTCCDHYAHDTAYTGIAPAKAQKQTGQST